jgi:hypothetical protein
VEVIQDQTPSPLTQAHQPIPGARPGTERAASGTRYRVFELRVSGAAKGGTAALAQQLCRAREGYDAPHDPTRDAGS